MPTIQQLSDHSQAALASYAVGLVSGANNTEKYKAQDVGMADTQAKNFDANWAVIQQAAPVFGFSAVLLQNHTTGEKVLAIAGTDPASPADWLADLVNVAHFGTVLGMPQYISLESFYTDLVVSGKLGTTEAITVTGHSLGGFLAQAFTARHTGEVSAAYTYNAPGFGTLELMQGFLGVSNLSGAAAKITNVHATDGLSITAGLGVMVGANQPVRIEAGILPTDNHSVVKLGDALAIHDAYAKLQPSITMEQAGVLFAGSGLGSLKQENALDVLRTVFMGSSSNDVNRTANGNRDAFYSNLVLLLKDPGFKSASGQVQLVQASSNFASAAQATTNTALAYRYTLLELLPVAVVANTDAMNQAIYGSYTQRLSLYDVNTGQGELTQNWMSDRAALLQAITARNTKGGDGVAYSSSFPTDRAYELHWSDASGSEQILIAENTARQGGVLTPVPHQVFAFGGDGADNFTGLGNKLGDHLYGGGGNDTLDGKGGGDYLEGGSGDDILIGGDGNDTLLGGTGIDTYVFTSTFGTETILDSDGLGQIKIGAVTLTGGNKQSDTVWESADKHYSFTLMGGNLVIGRGSAGAASPMQGTITVQNWSPDKNLDITLNNAPAVQPPPTHIYTGDQHAQITTDPETGSQSYDWNNASWAADGTLMGGVAEENYKDVIVGSNSDDKISGLGGNDALYGGGGNDHIDGGEGNDLIGGGGGTDTIMGGAGADIILSATGLNVFQRYGPSTTWSPTLAANGGSIVMDDAPDVIDAGEGNDLVYAGRGDDRIQGGAGNDELWGLAGNDIIEGGTGEDLLVGDGVNATGSYASSPGDTHGSDFLDGGDGNDNLIGFGGADVLYGGADNDRIYGDGYAGAQTSNSTYLAAQYHGDDYIDGEDGDDYVEGNGGADTIYGGAGADILWGDAASDILSGEFHGADYIDGEDGNDDIVGGGAADTLYGGAGNDRIRGDSSGFMPGEVGYLAGQYHGDDYLDGEDGNDEMTGDTSSTAMAATIPSMAEKAMTCLLAVLAPITWTVARATTAMRLARAIPLWMAKVSIP